VGDSPASIAELEKALSEAPQSRISPYLLGTALRRAGRLERSADVLRTSLLLYPDDPKLARALALTLVGLSRPLSEPLAVLRLAALEGHRDADFVCLYGGLLSMERQVDDANEVFKRARDTEWSIQILNRVGFTPTKKGGGEIWLRGRVAQLGPGYCFISVSGYPDFFCPGSNYGDLRPAVDAAVELRPGFTVRGPVGIALRSPRSS